MLRLSCTQTHRQAPSIILLPLGAPSGSSGEKDSSSAQGWGRSAGVLWIKVAILRTWAWDQPQPAQVSPVPCPLSLRLVGHLTV